MKPPDLAQGHDLLILYLPPASTTTPNRNLEDYHSYLILFLSLEEEGSF